MAFIGEITIKVEFPEGWSQGQAEIAIKERAKEAIKGMKDTDAIYLGGAPTDIVYHLESHSVYDEEEMRKELENE